MPSHFTSCPIFILCVGLSYVIHAGLADSDLHHQMIHATVDSCFSKTKATLAPFCCALPLSLFPLQRLYAVSHILHLWV